MHETSSRQRSRRLIDMERKRNKMDEGLLERERNSPKKIRTSKKEPRKFESAYGYFTEDGREYVITRPDTPRPWVNVICNGDYGLIESQAGSGFSWLDNSNLSRITRWDQDLITDMWGKYIYLRDQESK